ncbi:MAG TPA: malonyl-[acyl-carrier protein] O-methyltransferase BioC, partial [Candidatus Accumulibacter sp.]|nr:malonyl-[acyl-carrier protein] O-methyltransferase BioC [Accumulibacter sp.]
LADLRRSGSGCAMQGRRQGLTGRSAWAAARAAYQQLARAGRLPATLEVVYGHAWKGQPRKTADGRTIVRFEPGQRRR